MIDPYTTFGGVLGAAFGTTLGFTSKDLELDLHASLSENAPLHFRRSYVKTVVPEALKDRTFWQITLSAALLGAGFGKIAWEIQNFALSILS